MRYATLLLSRILLAGAMLAMASLSQVRADLVAGWDFQTTTNGGTALVAAPNTPKQITANFGSGGLFLDGQNGSSDWLANTELAAFGGTLQNTAGTGFSTVTAGAAALALVNQTANGKSAVFKFSMAGFQDLVVSYASQRTGTGFTAQVWSFSTDGLTWTDHQSVVPSSNFTTAAPLTLNNITGLNGATDAYLRLTVSGASTAAGNNRFDNIQFNATAVPEPTSMLLAGSVALGGVFMRLRRKR
jgi:hypothetical protein